MRGQPEYEFNAIESDKGFYLLPEPNEEGLGRATIPIHRYIFPDQETTIGDGDKLYDGGEKSWGTAVAIDIEARWIDVKKTRESISRHPFSIYAFNFVNAKPIPESLLSFGQELVNQTRLGSAMHDARYDLLAKSPPRLRTLTMPLDASVEEAAIALAMDLDHSVLPIQGPPGAGKTHVGSRDRIVLIGLIWVELEFHMAFVFLLIGRAKLLLSCVRLSRFGGSLTLPVLIPAYFMDYPSEWPLRGFVC